MRDSDRSRPPRWRTAIAGAVVCLLTAAVVTGCGDSESDSGSSGDIAGSTLIVGDWGGDYWKARETELFDPWSQETDVEVKTEDAPAEIVPKLRAQNAAGDVTWSLIDSTEEDLIFLNNEGLLEPLPEDLKADLIESLGEENVTDYGVRDAFSASVFVCNKDTVDRCPTNVQEFWDTENFPGRRALNGLDPYRMMLYALAAEGMSDEELQSGAPIDIDAALASIDEIRPDIQVFWTSGDQSQQILRDEEVDMAILWSGRAAALQEQGVNTEVSFDRAIVDNFMWAVPKGAPNADAAFDFLRWWADNPEAQANFAEEIFYGVPDDEAYDIVEPAVAKFDPRAPENRDQVLVPTLDWRVENQDEITKAWNDYLSQ